MARGRATTTGARTCRQVTRRQWNRRAANLCSAPASRRLLSELVVSRATFGSSIRHRWRQRLAHKSRRSSRTALFTRKAMNENVVGFAPLEGAHDGGCWRAHEYAASPSRSRRRTARPGDSARARRPNPKGIAGPVATRTPGHVGRRDPACSPAGAECSIRRATRRQTTWPDPENVWQRERTTIAQRTHRQGVGKEEA